MDNLPPGPARPGLLLLPTSIDPQPARHRLTPSTASRLHLATLFTPQDPNLAPETHFPAQKMPHRATRGPRMINRFDSREMLLVVGGSSLGNGRASPPAQGGCSFTYAPGRAPTFPFVLPATGNEDDDYNDGGTRSPGEEKEGDGTIAFRMERCGPQGDPFPHNSNRTKLRAVIAALQFRAWGAEGWRRVVVLTDLKYVAYGAAVWLPRWVRRGWMIGKGRARKKVENRDLWEELQGQIEALHDKGTEVSFWLVQSGDLPQRSVLLTGAKMAAKEAAWRSGKEMDEFTKIVGWWL